MATVKKVAAKKAPAKRPRRKPSKTVAPKKKVEADVYNTGVLTPEAISQMSEEQIAEHNRKETAKLAARKARQASNNKRLGDMSVSERIQHLKTGRDKSITRTLTPDDWDGDDLVLVVAKRRIGLGNGLMSDVGEEFLTTREYARDMQKKGIIEVAI